MMQNIKYAIKDGMLMIQVDLNEKADTFTPKSGNTVVATSDNWAKLPEMPGWNFNMILTKKPGAAMPRDTVAETRTASS